MAISGRFELLDLTMGATDSAVGLWFEPRDGSLRDSSGFRSRARVVSCLVRGLSFFLSLMFRRLYFEFCRRRLDCRWICGTAMTAGPKGLFVGKLARFAGQLRFVRRDASTEAGSSAILSSRLVAPRLRHPGPVLEAAHYAVEVFPLRPQTGVAGSAVYSIHGERILRRRQGRKWESDSNNHRKRCFIVGPVRVDIPKW